MNRTDVAILTKDGETYVLYIDLDNNEILADHTDSKGVKKTFKKCKRNAMFAALEQAKSIMNKQLEKGWELKEVHFSEVPQTMLGMELGSKKKGTTSGVSEENKSTKPTIKELFSMVPAVLIKHVTEDLIMLKATKKYDANGQTSS